MTEPTSTADLLKGDLAGHTPMMTQYLGIKAEHPDTPVVYRMVGSCEVFFDDSLQELRQPGIVPIVRASA